MMIIILYNQLKLNPKKQSKKSANVTLIFKAERLDTVAYIIVLHTNLISHSSGVDALISHLRP